MEWKRHKNALLQYLMGYTNINPNFFFNKDIIIGKERSEGYGVYG